MDILVEIIIRLDKLVSSIRYNLEFVYSECSNLSAHPQNLIRVLVFPGKLYDKRL